MRKLNGEIQLIKQQNNGIDRAKKKVWQRKAKQYQVHFGLRFSSQVHLDLQCSSVLTQISHLKSPVRISKDQTWHTCTHMANPSSSIYLFDKILSILTAKI